MTVERVTGIREVKETQHLTLDNRENLSVTGAKDVLSFSDTSIELDTNMGMLVVKGENLKIISISTENKTAELCGRVTSLEYKKQHEKKSILKSLFK